VAFFDFVAAFPEMGLFVPGILVSIVLVGLHAFHGT
jgi:hypothetical protein